MPNLDNFARGPRQDTPAISTEAFHNILPDVEGWIVWGESGFSPVRINDINYDSDKNLYVTGSAEVNRGDSGPALYCRYLSAHRYYDGVRIFNWVSPYVDYANYWGNQQIILDEANNRIYVIFFTSEVYGTGSNIWICCHSLIDGSRDTRWNNGGVLNFKEIQGYEIDFSFVIDKNGDLWVAYNRTADHIEPYKVGIRKISGASGETLLQKTAGREGGPNSLGTLVTTKDKDSLFLICNWAGGFTIFHYDLQFNLINSHNNQMRADLGPQDQPIYRDGIRIFDAYTTNENKLIIGGYSDKGYYDGQTRCFVGEYFPAVLSYDENLSERVLYQSSPSEGIEGCEFTYCKVASGPEDRTLFTLLPWRQYFNDRGSILCIKEGSMSTQKYSMPYSGVFIDPEDDPQLGKVIDFLYLKNEVELTDQLFLVGAYPRIQSYHYNVEVPSELPPLDIQDLEHLILLAVWLRRNGFPPKPHPLSIPFDRNKKSFISAFIPSELRDNLLYSIESLLNRKFNDIPFPPHNDQIYRKGKKIEKKADFLNLDLKNIKSQFILNLSKASEYLIPDTIKGEMRTNYKNYTEWVIPGICGVFHKNIKEGKLNCKINVRKPVSVKGYVPCFPLWQYELTVKRLKGEFIIGFGLSHYCIPGGIKTARILRIENESAVDCTIKVDEKRQMVIGKTDKIGTFILMSSEEKVREKLNHRYISLATNEEFAK